MAEAEEPSSDLEGSCQAALSNEDIVFQLILSVGGDKETLCRSVRRRGLSKATQGSAACSSLTSCPSFCAPPQDATCLQDMATRLH